MNEEGTLPLAAGVFLIVVGMMADALKLALDFIFVGFILDPLLITPITAFIFWITLNHNNIKMFGGSGKWWWVGWMNLGFSLLPGLDALLPDWTAYAVYLTIFYR